eukprot:m.1654957 g.1654957  ORF g.1654957 m.1654957 type:complete len:52 (+) comp102776_c0_seq1:161-316(+)
MQNVSDASVDLFSFLGINANEFVPAICPACSTCYTFCTGTPTHSRGFFTRS